MRKTARLLAAALVCILFSTTACNKDEKPVKNFLTGFVSAYTDSNGYLSVLVDDFGKRYPVGDRINTQAPNASYRLVVLAEMGSDSTLYNLQIIQPIATPATEDNMMADSAKVRDPLEVTGAYIGGGFLNITLKIKTQQEKKTHYLDYSHKIKHGVHTFKIYHNAYGDKPIYTRDGYLSIPLRSYGLHKNDTVSVSYMGYDGDCVLKVVYR